jgi:hypothetical protein
MTSDFRIEGRVRRGKKAQDQSGKKSWGEMIARPGKVLKPRGGLTLKSGLAYAVCASFMDPSLWNP